METIKINKEHKNFVKIYAEKQNIGGFSNLSKTDLNKSSRLLYQFSGLYGEISWFLYRYGSYDKLKEILDFKFNTLRPQRKGDGGFDDSITSNGKTRLVDIKTSHCESEERIKYLNLIIPEREFHPKMIYIAAFAIGSSREDVDHVVIAGWTITEDVHKRWAFDKSKFCVPVNELRPMKELEQYIR